MFRNLVLHFGQNGFSCFLGFQISRFPDFQTPPTAAGELSDPNLTPLPMHPGIKYVLVATSSISVAVGC